MKAWILRNHSRLAPVIRVAGALYGRAVVPYEAFDRANAEIVNTLGPDLSRALGARSSFELWQIGKAWEARFAGWCGRAHSVGTASGTAALQIALVAAGVGPGDEVITSAHTYAATVLAIRNTGATPILVDPDPGDLCLRAAAVRGAMTGRTRAIVPVHMHGHAAEVGPMLGFGVHVIEDCAQAHGCTVAGRRVPLGPTGCFSFFPSKPIGGTGNGGMIVTDDAALAARADAARDPDSADPIVLRAARTPSYPDPLQVALLGARLDRYEATRARRAANAAYYLERAAHLSPVLPAVGVESAWYSFVVRVPERDRARAWLLARGVETKVEYATPVFRSSLFADAGWRPDDWPVADRAAREGISIPVHAWLTLDERRRVRDALVAVAA